MNVQDMAIGAILESLEKRPEDWELDEFKAKNERLGVEVWISNGHYGLHIKTRDGLYIGGVTAMSSFFGWAIPWRRRVRAAVMNVAGERLYQRAIKL